MLRYYLSILLIMISLQVFSWVNIDSTRRMELDSLVTFMPKEAKTDLYALHDYIHSSGKNDEERVWMFYGYFAIHTRYDWKRCYDHKALYQTPEYTISKRRGVCRDFADAFRKLCDLSGIPCLNVFGRVNTNLLTKLYDLIHFELPNNRHQWNLVKINEEWCIMDPTWTQVIDYQKYYTYDKYGKKEYIGKTKIPDRTYYDAIPQNISRSHKPYHPAFFLLSKVPTFRTAFNLDSKRKWYAEDYDYNTFLDSLYAQIVPEYSHLWNQEPLAYSGHANPVNFGKNQLNYHQRLQDKDYKPHTLEDYYEHLYTVDSLATYYRSETGITIETSWYKALIDSLYIQKLEKEYAQH